MIIFLLFCFFGVAEASQNLVPNPDFEKAGPESWVKGRWGSNTAVFTYPAVSGDGSAAAEVRLTGRTSGDAKWAFPLVAVEPGATYEYKDDYSSDVPTYITAEIKLSDGTFSYPDIGNPPASAWTSETLRITMPTTAVSARIFHLINQPGTLSVDNVSFAKVDPPNVPPQNPPPASSNPIINPSFEAGTDAPSSWYKGYYGNHSRIFTYSIAGMTGKAARVEITSYVSGDSKWYFSEVPVSPGESYQFSDYYRSDVSTYLAVRFKKSDGSYSYDTLGEASPSADWKKFAAPLSVPAGAVSLTVFHVIKNIGRLDVDDYKLEKLSYDPFNFDKGYVSINFDDGLLVSYNNALPILDSAGFKSTQFIVTGRMNSQFPGYVQSGQVLDMQRRGHEIGAHTRAHADLTASPDPEGEIIGSMNDLKAIGIDPGFIAYPFGSYNDSVKDIVKNAGFKGGRSSDGGYNKKTGDKYALRRQPMLNTTTLDQVKGYIDTAMRDKTWVILLFHDVSGSGDTYAVTPALFQEIVDYMRSKNIAPITVSEGVAMML